MLSFIFSLKVAVKSKHAVVNYLKWWLIKVMLFFVASHPVVLYDLMVCFITV
jgi:hypothetical protein